MNEKQEREQLNPLFDHRIGLMEMMPGLIMFFIVGTSNIFTNSLLIYLMRKVRKLGQVTHIFILCLCISDICVGLNQILCVVLRIFMHKIDREVTHWLALTSFFLSYLFEPLSAALLILIAMDRYIHLKFLTTYSTIMTKRRAKILTKVCIVANLCFTTAIVLSMINGIYDLLNLILAAVYMSMLIAVTTFYITAYRSVKRRVRDFSVSFIERKQKWPANRNAGIFRGIVLILLSLIACYAPYVVLTIRRGAMHLSGKTNNDITNTLAFAYGFKCLSASINVIILIAFNKEYKRFMVTSFSNRCARRTRVCPLTSLTGRHTIGILESQYANQKNKMTRRYCMERGIETVDNNFMISEKDDQIKRNEAGKVGEGSR